MKINVLIGGLAGHGPNALAKVLGGVLAKSGFYVFVSREYGSYIRGGLNMNIITFSDKPVMSNTSAKDVLVLLGQQAENLFGNSKGYKVVLKGEQENMYFAGALEKLFGLELDVLKNELKKLGNYDKNLSAAKKGFNEGKKKFKLGQREESFDSMDGSEGISEGAIKSGVDVYFAYPMTPATSVLSNLAEEQIKNNIFVFEELEGEIAVANAAAGAACTGAKAMIGTSGGGFDLMAEALSLTGQAEIPLVIYLGQRLGPSTGAATYTGQGDLRAALGAGHGEFNRVVVAPGDPVECMELTSQAFYFSQKFKIPSIVVSDKHLAESNYTTIGEPVITKSEKVNGMKRYNSYEHDANGIANDSAGVIKENAERRMIKMKEIEREAENFEMFHIYGDEKSKNVVLFWGSTKGAVLDALANVNARAIQIKYLEPFSRRIASELKGAKKIVVVENNATSQLSSLIAEKTGILIDDKNKVLKYDGRPFLSDELALELKRRLR